MGPEELPIQKIITDSVTLNFTGHRNEYTVWKLVHFLEVFVVVVPINGTKNSGPGWGDQ